MKTKTPIPLLAMYLLCSTPCFSQSSLYAQSNKEIEYNYGVIADEDMNLISEIEKIKYEFRYSERTHVKTIDANYQTTLDITVDSNGYEQPWMNLAKRFHYDANGIMYYDKQGILMNTIPYTQEQRAENNELVEYARENGYHPGIASFPDIDTETKQALENQGFLVTINSDASITTIIYPTGEKETYNAANLTIAREWTDEDGLKNIETDGYEPYADHRGFLQTISKREKFLQSVNGPCITEVRLVYYTAYIIQDAGGLIDKATKQYREMSIYPNPNTGIFNVQVTLPANEFVTATTISNIMTGDIIQVNPDNAPSFSVNIQNQLPGHYVIRVVTNQTTLSSHFFKQ